MIVLSGALVLVALVLLVFGALDRNLPYVYASIGVSLLSLLLLLVGILQRRGELAGDERDDATPVTDTSDQRVPALVGAEPEQAGAVESAPERTAEPVLPAAVQQPASRRVAPAAEPDEEPSAGEPDEDGDVEAEAFDDEPQTDGDGLEDVEDPEDLAEFEDVEDEGSGVTVLVVSGRPRYHLEGCRVLRGKEPQPLDRDDARVHGFTPCGVCKPDADETAAAQEPAGASAQVADESFTETLFGGPLFADAPPQEAARAPEPAGDAAPATASGAEGAAAPDADERVETSRLPARPVQPVLAEVEPVADRDERPAELHGDDPADDPAVEVQDVQAVPAPDVPGDPDEPFTVAEPADAHGASADGVEPATGDAGAPAGAEPPPVAAQPAARRRGSRTTRAERGPVTGPADDDEAPAADLPVTEAAVTRSPAEQARAEQGPAKTAAATKVPAKKAPARKAPAKKAPAKKAPAKEAPAKEAPARAATAKAARTQAAPPPEPAAAPAVRRPMVRAVRPDALRLGAPGAGTTTTRVAARGAAPAAAAPVVVVPDRDRFHRPDCRFVRGVAGATSLPKASADRQGYTACGVCKP